MQYSTSIVLDKSLIFHRKKTMNKYQDIEVKILTGEIQGFILTQKEQREKSQKYHDQKFLSREAFLQKYSPFFNPHLRMTLEQIEDFRKENLDYALRSRKSRNLKTNLVLN
jgi:hypothetical protein